MFRADKKILFFCITVLSLVGIFLPGDKVYADLAMEHVYVFNFYEDGSPYEGKVDFQLSCYGTAFNPGKPDSARTSLKGEVLKIDGECEGFGCSLEDDGNNSYTRINSCEISGRSEDGNVFDLNDIEHPASNCDLRDDKMVCVLGIDMSKNKEMEVNAETLEINENNKVIVEEMSEGLTLLQFLGIFWYIPVIGIVGLAGLALLVILLVKKFKK